MFFLYALYSKIDDKFYVGTTENIDRRINDHMTGANATTSRYADLCLVFYEAFLAKADALRREHYFKTSKGKRVLKLMLQESLGSL